MKEGRGCEGSVVLDTREGVGGVEVLRHNSIGATHIGNIFSNCICGIRVSVDDANRVVMSVIGVHFPGPRNRLIS